MNQDQSPEKSGVAKREEATVAFWKEGGFFQKSLQKDAPHGDCVFYDGPPFATGLPHYGHILGGAGKDAIARYKTMRGFRVPRRWGWDTHGLPIETIVEKSLGITSKKQIEEMGLDVFAREARSKVLGFVSDWKKTVDRMGRWVDFDGSYKTMDTKFIESVWWALGQLNDKGLVYEADRILPYCPRCQTPLANAEIAMDNSYKDIVDISVYVKMEFTSESKERLQSSGREAQPDMQASLDSSMYLLAWTTTPWTLPGNAALAVNPELSYARVSFEGATYYVGKDRWEAVFKDKEAQLLGEVKGTELVGLSYNPPFDYFRRQYAGNEKAWHVYAGDFVTADTGTGIVHIAPSFGEDDASLAKQQGIPAIKHVAPDGTFVPEVTHFAGVQVKPKEDHQAADVEVIKYLAHNHLLFAKEKITHSYPHCYRCETPLLYYGLPSWFIRVQEFKPRMLELNQSIDWVPEHLRDGRFKHTLENAPDWNFSRNRFWASPLPIWKSESGKKKFIASLDELRTCVKKSGNTYYALRHGQAISNTKHVWESGTDVSNHLTDEGKQQVRDGVAALAGTPVDVIVASPVLRTQETAKIAAEVLGFAGEIVTDDRLREINPGDKYQGLDLKTFLGQFETYPERYTKPNPDGENYADVRRRVMAVLEDLEARYQGKTILLVTHGSPILNLLVGSQGFQTNDIPEDIEGLHYPKNGEVKKIDFVPFPHNEEYELDLHRPYIDSVKLEIDGEEYVRIPEVIDCWFESGSMPFAQDHFPFENPNWKDTNFPADFVVEYIAQTRTWFYYTLLLSTMLFDAAPFKHIVTTGNLNGTDGQKMSKSKGNYPDPWILLDKYGSDALRLYLLSSVLMKGEDSNFIEKSVDEGYKKVILRLENCLSFIDMYDIPRDTWKAGEMPTNVLDRWMMSRLSQVVADTTAGFEAYNTVEGTKSWNLFVDDLSAWYLRRSRDRFKSDDAADRASAGKTLVTALVEFSKLVAPIMPFIAEHLYQNLKGQDAAESVHLADWPTAGNAEDKVLSDMESVRTLVTKGLEARAKANIKVRQPLRNVTLPGIELGEEYTQILRDELNVWNVAYDESATEVVLDTNIDDELRAAGNVREVIRAIQDMRKAANLQPSDRITLHIDGDSAGKSLVMSAKEEIMKTVSADTITESMFTDGSTVQLDGAELRIKIG